MKNSIQSQPRAAGQAAHTLASLLDTIENGIDGDDASQAEAREALAKARTACNSHAALVAALTEAETVLRWAVQESAGRVDREKVGGWLHHADKLAALALASGGGR